MTFWKWLFKLSPDKASDPNPSPTDVNTSAGVNRPIEMFVEQEAVLGMGSTFGYQNSAGRGTNGLERYRKRFSVLCGCGHVVSQLHAEHTPGKPPQKGLGGKCYHCEKDLQKMFKKGLIPEAEAERQALVCSDCAKMVSGFLCCPKHYIEVTDENGDTVYLGPDDQLKQKRKETIQKILTPFAVLFSEPDRRSESEDNDE